MRFLLFYALFIALRLRCKKVFILINLSSKFFIAARQIILGLLELKTRSQAVARIADRTAQNCKGHVT